MKVFAVIHHATGKVLRSGTCPDDMIALQASSPDEIVLAEQVDDSRHYFDPSTLTRHDRPVMAARLSAVTVPADGTTEVELTGLPTPCTVTIGTAVYDVPDGSLSVTFDAPARYLLRVEAFPHQPAEFEVIAV